MKKLFKGGCAKGCLIYMAALAMVGVLGAAGLGGLSANLGTGTGTGTDAQTSKPGVRAMTTSREPAAPTPQSQKPAESSASASQQGDAEEAKQTQPTAQPSQAAPPQVAPLAGANTSLEPRPDIEGIIGQATSPFYIVQPEDTLWAIASKFGISVEDLKSINKLGNEFIQPKQLLYLPGPSQPSAATPAPAEPPPTQPAGDAAPSAPSAPSLPGTGINTEP